jgi:hypothetical protein
VLPPSSGLENRRVNGGGASPRSVGVSGGLRSIVFRDVAGRVDFIIIFVVILLIFSLIF